MFELETAIEDWKKSLRNRDSISEDAILELETHLRDLVADLQSTGLNPREALMVAADRLGHPKNLDIEFGKVNVCETWRKRVYWMLSGYIAMTVGGAIVSTLGAIAGTGMAVAGVDGSTAGAGMITAMALGWSGLLVIAYRQSRQLGAQFQHQWFVAAGIILVLAPLVTLGFRIAQSRVVGPSWLGESALLLGIGGWSIQLGVVAVCYVAMYLFSRTANESPA